MLPEVREVQAQWLRSAEVGSDALSEQARSIALALESLAVTGAAPASV